MSYTKRTRGLRSITVEDTMFRWRFSQKRYDSTLAVYGPNSGFQPLVVTFRGWENSWVVYSFADTNEGTVIGPKFVSQTIIYGLANGWLPNQNKAPMCVNYQEGEFGV